MRPNGSVDPLRYVLPEHSNGLKDGQGAEQR
jgi:hypothetical protein